MMRRRSLLTLLGGAASAWPLAVRAQQSALPLVGFLGLSSPDADGIRAFHLGLKETGHVEGDNITILQHWTAAMSHGLVSMSPPFQSLRRSTSMIWSSFTCLDAALSFE
jgi:putative ABC transport system substrate-binding protein